MKPLRVLSLGAGVQSSTLLLMSCRGDLPKLDAAIFADTQWEAQATYAHIAWLADEASGAGIPLLTPTKGSLRNSILADFVRGCESKNRYATIPAFVQTPEGMQRIKKQCSREFKGEVVDRCIREEVLGVERGKRAPMKAVEQWFGFSTDELRRVRVSRDHWRTFAYPLIDPLRMNTDDCVDWLRTNYPGRHIPRSLCIGCPNRLNSWWRAVRENLDEWADAVEVDRAIRHADGMRGEVFLHRSGVPLEDVDLRTDVDKGQGLLFGPEEECLGYCGT